MDRGNHYEAAFEAYLRDRRLGYVAIDEGRRATLDDEPVKSIDFIVYGEAGTKFLVDIKGRKFPGGADDQPRNVWQNWVFEADIAGLERWEERFGTEYRGLLVFPYLITPRVELRRGTADLWHWRGKTYLLRAVAAAEYKAHMRVRSRKWGTVHLPTAEFRRLVRPLREFTHPHDAAVGAVGTS